MRCAPSATRARYRSDVVELSAPTNKRLAPRTSLELAHRVERSKRHRVRCADLASVHGDGRVGGPLVTQMRQLDCVTRLPLAKDVGRRPRQLATVVRAHGLGRAIVRWTVEQHNDVPHLVQLHEIFALATKLLRAEDISIAR